MPDDHDNEQILQVAVPQWRPEADGAWTRDWEIVLAEPTSGGTFQLSENGVEAATSVLPDRRTLRITTRTELNAWSDELFYAAAYRMLRRIDEEIGRMS